MMPFRPKPPNYGGKLAQKKEAEQERFSPEQMRRYRAGGNNANTLRMWQLAEGGPVERAIKADLIQLRTQFKRKLYDQNSYGKNDNTTTPIVFCHTKLGSTFQIFKQVYRDGRFGAIHTRCIPPRSDREAYLQLIYSAALSLLEDAFEEMKSTDETEGDLDGNSTQNSERSNHKNRTGSRHHFIEDASFAMFSLYTLFQTNPYPSVPLPTTEEFTLSPSSSDQLNQKQKEALSTLSMGQNSSYDEKVHRRAYHAPIRISPKLFALVNRLREDALEYISSCQHKCCRSQMQRYVMNCESTDESAEEQSVTSVDNMACESANDHNRWSCLCGPAKDCVNLIDRLHSNRSFYLCEYSGPVSLEGLTGSKEYFDRIVVPKHFQRDCSLEQKENNGIEAQNLQSLSFNLNELKESFTAYHNSLDQISVKSLLNAGLKNQGERVQSCLQPILARQDLEAVQSQNDILERMYHQMARSGEEGSRDTHCSDELDTTGIATPFEAQTIITQLREKQLSISDETNTKTVRFSFPSKFNSALKLGIGNALENLQERISLQDKDEKHVQEEQSIALGLPESVAENSVIDLSSAGGYNALQTLLDCVADNKEYNQHHHPFVDDDDDIDTSMHSIANSIMDDLSCSGQNALQKLLTSAACESDADVDDMDMHKTKAKLAKKRKRHISSASSIMTAEHGQSALQSLLSIAACTNDNKNHKPKVQKKATDSVATSANESIATVEPGQSALQSLLSRAACTNDNAQRKKPHTNKSRSDKKALSHSTDSVATSMNESVVTAEPGQSALQSLLSMAAYQPQEETTNKNHNDERMKVSHVNKSRSNREE